ncbi:transposase [Micromonospora taraxaci]|uniref:transposase n=1 Tax=Micromonospora taraxaci TaxID=1316803 RepID=UPI003403B625
MNQRGPTSARPASPTTTGKVERFHQTLRRELLDEVPVWPDLDTVQAAVDAFRHEYNIDRPHQSLDMAFPADRFTPVPEQVVPVKLPARLTQPVGQALVSPPVPAPMPVLPAAVEFDRVVPPSGNLQVAGKQFWLGLARSGVTVTFWADTDVIHLLTAGTRIKSVRSHLSAADLAGLLRQGGRPAGEPTLPQAPPGVAVEVDRSINRGGHVSLGQHIVLAAEILGGQRVGIRIEDKTLSFFDLDTGQLLRTRPNPLTAAEVARLRGAPARRTAPATVDRTGAGAALGLQQRRRDGGRAESRPRPRACWQNRRHQCHRDGTGHRLRRRHAHRATHYRPTRAEFESQPAAQGRPANRRATSTETSCGARPMTHCASTRSAAGSNQSEAAPGNGFHSCQQRRMQLIRVGPGDGDLGGRCTSDIAAAGGHHLQQTELDSPGLSLVQAYGRVLGHETDHAVTMPRWARYEAQSRARQTLDVGTRTG